MNELKNAVIYVRVSTDEQKIHGVSLDMQERQCKIFAKENGYNIVKVYREEGYTARNEKRPKYKQLFIDIKHDKTISAVIVWRCDRISRNNQDYHSSLVPIFKKYNVLLLSATEKDNDMDDPEQKYHRDHEIIQAEYESRKTSLRTKSSMKEKAEQGKYPGKVPVGYLNMTDENDHKYIIVDEINKRFIRNCFEYYSTGMYSLESLGKKMFLEGFKDKYDKPYRARKFEEILKNIFYIGDFIWKGQRYKGNHQPIINKKLFYKVQSMFGKTNRPSSNCKNYPYTKFIKCPQCGCYLTAESKKGGHNSGNYTYYHCSNRKRQHTTLKGMSIDSNKLEMGLIEILESFDIPDEVVRFQRQDVLSNLNKTYDAENWIYDYRKNRIKELNTLIRKSYEDKLLGKLPSTYTDEMFNQQCSEWKEEVDKLTIEQQESKDLTKHIYNDVNQMIDFCNRIQELFKSSDSTIKDRLIRMIVKEIYFDGEELTVILEPIFEVLRQIKIIKTNNNNQGKVRTLENTENIGIAEFLLNQTKEGKLNHVRTPKTAIISKKTDPNEPVFEKWAGSGIRTHA